MIKYDDNTNTFSIIDNAKQAEIAYYEAFCQELRLWLSENPLNIELGIDYKGVLEGKVYLPLQLQEIINSYEKYFQSIELGDTYQENEVLVCDIIIKFSDDTSKVFSFGGIV